MITIVDYGMGNLGSISNILRYVGEQARVTSDPEAIRQAEKLILPGVGAFDAAMARINDGPIRAALDESVVERKVPVLGICLGMQLLTRGSEEGSTPGLGWIDAETVRFPAQPGLKVPHMGWNTVEPTGENPLTRSLPEGSRFYFVHSYYVRTRDPAHAMLKAFHGVSFDAGICRDHIFGVQFHPEKSHKFGMNLLRSFASL